MLCRIQCFDRKKEKTWDLVNHPSNRKVLTNKWEFRIKYRIDGSIERIKGRLVVRSFEQVHGLGYEETFSPLYNFILFELYWHLLFKITYFYIK